jgi:hypothetical protein
MRDGKACPSLRLQTPMASVTSLIVREDHEILEVFRIGAGVVVATEDIDRLFIGRFARL